MASSSPFSDSTRPRCKPFAIRPRFRTSPAGPTSAEIAQTPTVSQGSLGCQCRIPRRQRGSSDRPPGRAAPLGRWYVLVLLCSSQSRRFTMRIVIIGGTGLIGSKTVPILRQGGHEVVAASPNTGVNTITGEGLKQAMAGTQVVIDLDNSP